MRHDFFANCLTTEYTRLSDISGYLRSPIAMHDDGTMLGAYLVEAGEGRIRVTDDAQILLHAMINGVPSTTGRSGVYRALAEQCGVRLSDDGELFVECEEESAPYYVARFLEAADRISYLSVSHRQKPSGRFEKAIGEALQLHFHSRLAKRVGVRGASGHTLKFPFMLDETSACPVVIQPVSATDGRLDWGNVYHAVGKFTDLKNNRGINTRRIAVLEASEDLASTQAKAALSEIATVVVYRSADQLAGVLKAA